MPELLKRHPLSKVWTDMPDDEFYKLIEDVKENGVRQKIVIHDGQVIDGWHRYAASIAADRDCPAMDFIGQDIKAFVISQNALRRHLSPGEIARAIVKTNMWTDSTAPIEFESATNLAMAEAAGVSERTIRRAKKAIEQEESGDHFVVTEKRKTKAELLKSEIEDKNNIISELKADVEKWQARCCEATREVNKLSAQIKEFEIFKNRGNMK